MNLVERTATTEIWLDTSRDEYYAYQGQKLIRVCPSLGMAREVLAGY